MQRQARDRLPGSFGPAWGASVLSGVKSSVARGLQNSVLTHVGERIWQNLGRNLRYPVSDRMRDRTVCQEEYSCWHSICAYDEAEELALLHFFATYFRPNQARALAQFNQMVSGYWLGKEAALIVRRPTILTLEEGGLLHSETGRGVEYADGWGSTPGMGCACPNR